MANEGESSHSKGIPLKQANEIRRHKAIIELQEQVRKLIMELAGVKGFVPPEQQGYSH